MRRIVFALVAGTTLVVPAVATPPVAAPLPPKKAASPGGIQPDVTVAIPADMVPGLRETPSGA